MHVRGMSGTWLATFTRQVTEESRLGRPGSDTVLTRLAELMFIEVLRRYLEDLGPGQTGWLAGLRDEAPTTNNRPSTTATAAAARSQRALTRARRVVSGAR